MKNKNMPAFPTQELNSDIATHPMSHGMTLRDYFAGQVLGVLVSKITHQTTKEEQEAIPHVAYYFADSMMEEREK